MPHVLSCLVVLDPNSGGPFLAAIVRPANISAQHILGPLEPLKANYSCSGWLGPPALDAAPSEGVHLLPCDSRFLFLGSTLAGDSVPWVRHLSIEFVRVQPSDYVPSFAAERNSLFALP